MPEFVKWLQDPTVQTIGWMLGAVGWIVGVVSAYVQIRGYRDQKAMEGAYREILAQAQRDWKGKYTEEQVTDLTAQMRKLQETIAEDVPREARRVFVENQLRELRRVIDDSHEQYKELSRERHILAGSLPTPIVKAIEKAAEPRDVEKLPLPREVLISVVLSALIVPAAIALVVTSDAQKYVPPPFFVPELLLVCGAMLGYASLRIWGMRVAALWHRFPFAMLMVAGLGLSAATTACFGSRRMINKYISREAPVATQLRGSSPSVVSGEAPRQRALVYTPAQLTSWRVQIMCVTSMSAVIVGIEGLILASSSTPVMRVMRIGVRRKKYRSRRGL